jgi:hypothetical protein
MIWIYGHKQA